MYSSPLVRFVMLGCYRCFLLWMWLMCIGKLYKLNTTLNFNYDLLAYVCVGNFQNFNWGEFFVFNLLTMRCITNGFFWRTFSCEELDAECQSELS
jgi:hypothetical protein